MIAIAANELIAELEGAIKGGPPERCARILQKITHLFLLTANRLDGCQVGVFSDIFIRLIERTQSSEHVWLGATLSALRSAPYEVINRLARHEEATVAVPILLKSEVLSAADLIEIATHHSRQHLLAISGRRALDEAVTDVLLARDDIAVCRALARNVGARFSEQGRAKLAAAAERDGAIVEALVFRPDVPIKMLHDVLAGATKAAHARYLKTAPPETREIIREIVETISAGAKTVPVGPVDYSAAKSKVLALSQAGQLRDSAVNRFAVHGERANLVAALSLLSDAAIETIEPLLREGDCHGLIVACRASRLNWQTTLAIVNSRTDAEKLKQDELERGRELFEALCLSVAQRTIRFGSVRDFVKLCFRDNSLTAARAI